MYTDNKQLDDITQDSIYRKKSQLDKHTTENIWRFGGGKQRIQYNTPERNKSIVE